MMSSRSKHRSSVEVCADCGASDPSWVSINRGLLLCAECCSIHRSMGRHISQVKSLRQGTWPPSLLAAVQAMNAQNVNSVWEHTLLDASAPKHLRKKPQPKDPLHPVKSEFIQSKHLRLAYVLRARRDEPPSELGRQLHSAVRSSSLDTAMRLLAQGADPNYYHQEKGTMCLHSACRAGQPAQAELLVAWGADPAARDSSGLLPADCARQGGHKELAERMTELMYETTDRIIYFLTGEKPDHSKGQHFRVPRTHDAHEMTDVAKAARGKLQLLPNHLFEELVMDIYDEIDRRETEAIWQTSATGLERSGIVFLPVNPALSAPRNQGRQKLARLSNSELSVLLRDVLVDVIRRQCIANLHPLGMTDPKSHLRHMSTASDDEPLYDSVASDDDYAALAPVDLDMPSEAQRTAEAVSSTYNPSLSSEQSFSGSPKLRRQSPSPSRGTFSSQTTPEHNPNPQVVEILRKELAVRDSTIAELKTQLKSLQTVVEQLTKENSVLKSNSEVDDSSVASLSLNSENVLEESKERGKSMETDQTAENDSKGLKSAQRPVSMYEPREGPKNNWQVTKHQLTTLTGLDRSLTQSVLDGACTADLLPSYEMVHRRAEIVTRGITELWAAAREQHPRLSERGDVIKQAVKSLLALFPPSCSDRELDLVLAELRMACEAVSIACDAPTPLHEVRAAAYDLAKATKALVTHFPALENPGNPGKHTNPQNPANLGNPGNPGNPAFGPGPQPPS